MTALQPAITQKKEFDQFAMIVGEFIREYVARAKGLAIAVRYHGVVINDEEICRRILTSLPPNMLLGWIIPLSELEHALVKVEELQKRPDGSDGHALAAGFKSKNQGGRDRGRPESNITQYRRLGRNRGPARHQR